MRSIIISAVLAVGTVAVSCSRSGLETPPVPPRPNGTPVEVSVTTAPLETPLALAPAGKAVVNQSKATASEAMTVAFGGPKTKATSLTSEQEGKIHDLWVIQFDKASGALVGQPYYAGPEQIVRNGAAVSFEAKLTTASTAQVVYFVANTNSPSTFSAANCGTVTAMESVCRRIGAEYKPTAAGGLPMLAAKEYPAIASGTPLTGATLRRLVAKVVLRYRVSPDFAGFTLTGVRLRNVPTTMWYAAEKSGAVDFPAKNTAFGSESHIDYPAEDLAGAVADGDYMTLTWYVPENLRKAVATVSDERERTTDKTDGMATYVELTGDFKSPLRCERLAYRILLGDAQNDVNDYNVRRNRVYTATVTIQGRNAADKRVEVGTFDMNNSAMLVPNSRDAGAVTFDVRKLTKGWQTTLPTLGTGAALRAQLLWTDNAALASQLNIALDKVNGLLTVKSTGTAQGNAVVALYNSAAAGSGEVLWSWHIWVTDYRPDGGREYGLPANSKAVVAGGQVHTYGTQFMAKNPGKVIMDRNLGATKAYYAPPAAGDATADQAFGMFYQWGRKDPLPRADGATIDPTTALASTITIFGPDGTMELLEDMTGYKKVSVDAAGSDAPATLNYAIQNPLTFIYNSGGKYDWYTANGTQNDDLWGGVTKKKSDYDPCPEGWRVPPDGTWADFGSNAYAAPFWFYINGVQQTASGTPALVKSARNGRLYEVGYVNAWYPAPGHRYTGTGVLTGVGNGGFSWSSSVDDIRGLDLNFHSAGSTPSGLSTRAYGVQVRCIQE